MRNALRSPFFIAVAVAAAAGSFTCGLITWLYSASMGQAVVVGGMFVVLAFLVATAAAIVATDVRRRTRKPARTGATVKEEPDRALRKPGKQTEQAPGEMPASVVSKGNKPASKLGQIAVGVLGFLAYFLLVLGLLANWLPYVKQDQEAIGWPSTTGRVISSSATWSSDSQSGGDYWFDISYEYQVDGSHLEGSDSWGPYSRRGAYERAQRYPPGSEVEVHYDPKDPGRSVLWPGLRTEEYLSQFRAGLILLALAGSLFGLVNGCMWLKRRVWG